jgi:purine-binding chemotaxis protein CheW
MGRFGIFVSSIEMADDSVLHAVIFRVGALICGAPAGIVREILSPLPATRIPGVGAAVSGIVNVRGALLTVLDAHRLLGQERPPGGDGAILVLRVADRWIGLEVAEVRDFCSLPVSAVAPRSQLPGVDPAVVQAVGRHGGRHFVILDLDALCAPVLVTEHAAVP